MPIDDSRPFKPVRIAVLTVSDTRGPAEDTSGDLLVQRLTDAGHILAARAIVRDELEELVARIHNWIDDPDVDCVISTGVRGSSLTALAPGMPGKRGQRSCASAFRLGDFWPELRSYIQ